MGIFIIVFYINFLLYTAVKEVTFNFSAYLPPPQAGGSIIEKIFNTFLIIYSVVGDWYPTLRTKAVIKNKRSIKFVYAACLIYNALKIYCFSKMYSKEMFRISFDDYQLIVIGSIIYDITILYVMRKNLFNRTNMNNSKMLKNSFMERFKQTSEYRIYCSIIVSLFLIPMIILYHIYKYILNKNVDRDQFGNGIAPLLQTYLDIVLSFNYYIIFIDQILLKFYVKRKDSNYKISSHSITSSYNKGMSSFNPTASYNSITSIHGNPVPTYNGLSTSLYKYNNNSSSTSISNSYYNNILNQNRKDSIKNMNMNQNNFDEEMNFSYNIIKNASTLHNGKNDRLNSNEYAIHLNSNDNDQIATRKYSLKNQF
ncbi:hypothetical protein BCR36DRAFT_295162 [Piromyces finnis]|uniref:Uncharacterized protein n=1 Tax=Piromyces finnis TaxID=1754191 RepID=A0A1Y1V5J4_9FUNG|nr:hypothetical protein BCR36DRAFT_295162 [Piromyces finnis]|eukprot:ORX47664.1 hypothetical protein BCR36DRAFT_295162 [Piromyces finnis]